MIAFSPFFSLYLMFRQDLVQLAEPLPRLGLGLLPGVDLLGDPPRPVELVLAPIEGVGAVVAAGVGAEVALVWPPL